MKKTKIDSCDWCGGKAELTEYEDCFGVKEWICGYCANTTNEHEQENHIAAMLNVLERRIKKYIDEKIK